MFPLIILIDNGKSRGAGFVGAGEKTDVIHASANHTGSDIPGQRVQERGFVHSRFASEKKKNREKPCGVSKHSKWKSARAVSSEPGLGHGFWQVPFPSAAFLSPLLGLFTGSGMVPPIACVAAVWAKVPPKGTPCIEKVRL